MMIHCVVCHQDFSGHHACGGTPTPCSPSCNKEPRGCALPGCCAAVETIESLRSKLAAEKERAEKAEAQNRIFESFGADAIALLRTSEKSGASILLEEMIVWRPVWNASPRAALKQEVKP